MYPPPPSWITAIVIFLNFYALRALADETLGSSLFQCPNGYFLSKFGTAFDGSERFYKFSCSKFSTILSFDEECSLSDVASTEDEDMYLSCGSDQYTAGVEILESTAGGVTTWQLLCCKSESVIIRNNDCIDTKFINDLRRPSSFSSGAQIIRKWQAMTENNDLRWWLQLCPVDISVQKPENEKTPIRARRQLPRGWSRGRFPTLEYHPAYMGHVFEPSMSQEKIYEQKRLKLIEKTNQVQTLFPMAVPTFSTTVQPKSEKSSEISYKADEKKKTEDSFEDKGAFVTESPVSTKLSKPPSREDTALDYYDAYDDTFDKAKHEGKGGFLSGVSDLLQNLQDGISLAQAVMPGNKPSPKPTPSPSPSVLMSRDENSLSIGVQDDGPNNKFDSIVKLQRFGPNPPRPAGLQTTPGPTTLKLGDPSAIQQMLQFFGLCKGHEL